MREYPSPSTADYGHLVSVCCGRRFSADELLSIKRLIDEHPTLERTPLSRRICERFGWVRPNGGLKDMTCRVAIWATPRCLAAK